MTREQRSLAAALHDINRMIIQAAEMHRTHTRLLIVLLEAGANATDIVNELRANEELFCGFLTRIGCQADLARVTFDGSKDHPTTTTRPEGP